MVMVDDVPGGINMFMGKMTDSSTASLSEEKCERLEGKMFSVKMEDLFRTTDEGKQRTGL